ncbi:malto-oligosyltrehalose trehalohydrolase [Floridanema aerugineum]|uniref:Malto-oligosyltrehalose trehalohydrolase n=1 Tax=Floridaenema aerugineum BLCC-F46 TaxID=3153654 RepID=A0ABV4XH53_9CYAN
MVKVGANYLGNARCQFTVWAPLLKEVAVKIVSPNEQLLPMQQLEYGFWQATAEDIEAGSRYVYQLEGNREFPDPASYLQPEGVHKASEVFDHSTFSWTDRDWTGIRLEDYIIYELHIGTFTPEGTFEAVIPRLTRLKELGINAIEIMPVSQFPGDRNWGYDGVYPYAVQNTYGGPDGLKKLINACHLEGISVILDVVYNHLGPEGNYLPNFGPYFTKKYLGDWGDAPNLDFAYCDGVREYFLENALYWLDTFHVDALRLDAIQGIYDFSAKHFLEELAERVHALSQQKGRKFYLTAESDFNDVRIIRPKEVGGYGLDAQWCDDFHHSLHTLITGERQRYYQDFGKCKDLEKSLREGFVYSGQYSPDRKRRHGNSSAEEPAYKFIVCAQNHDQTGNRILGERMTKLTSFEGLKLTAGTLILSPFIPLLFMGEEYGEEAPFFYFISHSDHDLIEAVRQSKKDEFLQSGHEKDFQDPQDQGTFNKCVLNWEQQYQDKHKVLWEFYQELIFLRRINEALKVLDKKKLEVSSREEEKLLFMRRYSDENQVFYVMNFSDRTLTFDIDTPSGSWQKLLDSADIKWMGPGATMPDKLIPGELLTMPAKSFVLYQA